jgi:hypothetical protein
MDDSSQGPADAAIPAKPATRSPISPDSPLLIREWSKNNRGEVIRVQLGRFGNAYLFLLRTWYTADNGHLRPGNKGFTATVEHLSELASAVQEAETKARELGLI